MIDARPTRIAAVTDNSAEVAQLREDVESFRRGYEQFRDAWRSFLQDAQARRQRMVLWGGGSKAVAFLTTLGIRSEIEYVVDINPYKHGTFLTATGQEIVSPEFLRSYAPDYVVLMNPIYRDEVQRQMDSMGVQTRLISVDQAPAASAAHSTAR
jgi:hypothetical protein